MTLSRIVLACVLSTLVAQSSCVGKISEGAIGYPEKEENPNLKNKEDRQPVFLPSMCPENQLYYPGDQKDDWICDCRPSHLYQPASDKCWPAYRRGPCAEGQYLVLPPKSYIPLCVPNPCQVDMYVPYNGPTGQTCERLGSTTPCEHLYPNAYALEVNATTLQIGCGKLNLESRFLQPTVSMSTACCLPGCKRSVSRKCAQSKT